MVVWRRMVILRLFAPRAAFRQGLGLVAGALVSHMIVIVTFVDGAGVAGATKFVRGDMLFTSLVRVLPVRMKWCLNDVDMSKHMLHDLWTA